MLLSDKLRFDLKSMMTGFKWLCDIVIKAHPGGGIVAGRTKSNIIEKILSTKRVRMTIQITTSIDQYCSTMNGIILGQHTTTKKSNTGSVDNLAFFKPVNLVPKN